MKKKSYRNILVLTAVFALVITLVPVTANAGGSGNMQCEVWGDTTYCWTQYSLGPWTVYYSKWYNQCGSGWSISKTKPTTTGYKSKNRGGYEYTCGGKG